MDSVRRATRWGRIVVGGFFAAACAARADTVLLKNGNALEGVIRYQDAGRIEIALAIGGTLTVSREDVAEVRDVADPPRAATISSSSEPKDSPARKVSAPGRKAPAAKSKPPTAGTSRKGR